MSGQYPNAYYRVSVKALIRNDKGEVLLVKENADFWNLPGGGIDHGETLHDALVRELYEEVLINAPFEEKLIAAESIWLEHKQAWLLWLVCEVQIDDLQYGVGKDAAEVTFIDSQILKDSARFEEALIHKLTEVHKK